MDCVLHLSLIRIEKFGSSAEVFGIPWVRDPVWAQEHQLLNASSYSSYVIHHQTIMATY